MCCPEGESQQCLYEMQSQVHECWPVVCMPEQSGDDSARDASSNKTMTSVFV